MTLLDQPARTIASARVTVAVAGTRVQVTTTHTQCAWVIVQAYTANTNLVTIGGSDVVGATATRVGVGLVAGEKIALGPVDLSTLWVDAITNAEGVTVTRGEL